MWEAVIDSERLGDWLGGELDVTLRPGGRGSFRVTEARAATAHRARMSTTDTSCRSRGGPRPTRGAASTVTITVDDDGDGGSTVRVRETRAHAMLATA